MSKQPKSMVRQMARQMIQRKHTLDINDFAPAKSMYSTKNQAHPVDLDSLDDLERLLFDALTPYFARLASQQAHYDAATFVDTVAGTFDQCVATQIERDIAEHWDKLSAAGVPKSDYTTLVTETIQAVYAEYLSELAVTVGQNRKPARFGQARAFAIATTELTALRALVMIVLMGTYNDLIEMAVQNAR